MKNIRLALVAILCATTLPAQMFRGDAAHTGTTTLSSPADEGRNLIGLQWRSDIGSELVSTPVVADDLVVIGGGDGRLYALDRLTGSRAWTFAAGTPIHSSPAIHAGRVFFAGRDGSLWCVDAAKGTRRWRVATGPDKPLPWGHETGDYYIASPVIAPGNRVIFGAGDGNVYAIDEQNGTVVWTSTLGERIRSTPAVAEGRIFVGTVEGRLYALDLESGKRLWTFATEGTKLNSADFGFDRRTIQSSPAVSDGIVYFGARDGWVYAVGAADGNERWRYDHKVSWIITSPAVAGGVVYDASSDGAFIQALSAADGKEIWRTPVGAPVWTSPTIAGGVVYCGDHAGRVHAFDRTTGKELWFFRSAGNVLSSPVVSNDLLFFGSSDGSIYALHVGRDGGGRRAFFGHSGDDNPLDRFLKNRGYEALDADALAAFLRDRTADRAASVVVLANDEFPSEVIPLLPLYLQAGGKIVATGIPPALWPPNPKTGKRSSLSEIDYAAPGRLFGVDHSRAMFDKRGVHATATGLRWGLKPYWRGSWGVAPSSVTDVLGLDEWGLASAWVRNLGGAPGTGLVYVPDDDPHIVYLAAEYRPATR